jgi:hypothetical protein
LFYLRKIQLFHWKYVFLFLFSVNCPQYRPNLRNHPTDLVLLLDLIFFKSEESMYILKALDWNLINGWMDCQWGVALLHAGHKTGLMSTTVYLYDVTITYFLYLSWVYGRNNFCVACIWFKIVWNYWLSYSCYLSINWLAASLTPTITVSPDWFWIRLSL